MKPSTDSELQERWKANELALTLLKPGDGPQREELLRERERIKIEWDEVLRQKRDGVLTDRSCMDSAIEVAKALSLTHGIKLVFREHEGWRDSRGHPGFWWLTGFYGSGAPYPCDRRFYQRLERLAVAVSKEMAKAGVLARVFGGDFSLGTDVRTGCPLICWPVKSWVWGGP